VRIPGIPFHQGRNDYIDSDGLHFGIAIHNTSNTASDESEASYADHRTDGTSSHFYVDADTVIQSLDTNDKAGHAGSREGNENAIAFELTGTNDKSRQWWLDNIAWDRLGYVIAYILQHDPDYAGFQVRRASVAEMKANPRVKAFYSHDDMRLAWGGTTHDDPGPNFPWDRLFSAVNAALDGGDDMLADERDWVNNADKYGLAITNLLRPVPNLQVNGKTATAPNPLADLLLRLEAKTDAALKALGLAQADIDELQARPALDVAALAAALAPLLTDHLGVEVSADQLVAALESDAGQAALVKAANTAEDS